MKDVPQYRSASDEHVVHVAPHEHFKPEENFWNVYCFATNKMRDETAKDNGQTAAWIKAPSTRIRIFSNPQLFRSGYGYRPHVSGEFDSESANFPPLSRSTAHALKTF